MKVFYLDPGLATLGGHHPVHCRLITAEFRSRGFETKVFAHLDVDRKIRADLGAEPHFRHMTYAEKDADPVCGWLTAYDRYLRVAFEDVMRIEGIGPNDLVYLATALPIELAAISAWMARCPPGAMPAVVADFCSPPGVELERRGSEVKMALPDPRQNMRPLLYRYTATRMLPQILPRLRLIAFEPDTAALYQALLGRRVDAVPLLFEAVTERRNRAGKRPIVVAVLGHQQRVKGYELVPEIVRLMLRERPELRFLIHNSDPRAVMTHDPAGLAETQTALRGMAAQDPRIELCEEAAYKEHWASLLDRADLVLCPYVAEHYMASFSAVAVEAIANACPVVGPAGCSLEALIKEFGGAGTAFEPLEPARVAAAAIKLVDDFDRYATRAHEAAKIWPTRYGPRAAVDAVLRLAAPQAAAGGAGGARLGGVGAIEDRR